MPDRLKSLLLPALLILAAVFGGTGGALYLDDADPATTPIKIVGLDRIADALAPTEEVTVDLPGSAPALTLPIDSDNQQTAADEQSAPTDRTLGLHEDARDETPPGVEPAKIDAGQEKAGDVAEALPAPQEPAGAQAYSCPNAFVVNQSALSGPRVGVALHFTVSSPGSLDAIRGLFNTPSFGASSNYGIELAGRCQTWVPPSRKAWTQGAFNSNYTSIEIVTNDLSRSQWLAAPIIKRGILAALVRDELNRVGAPARRVDPVGCTPLAGIVGHNELECGNSHWDVGPGFPWDVFVRQVRLGVKVSPLSKAEKRIVARTSKGSKRSKARACQANRAQRATLREASRRSPAKSRKLRRGARRKLLDANYKRRCQ